MPRAVQSQGKHLSARIALKRKLTHRCPERCKEVGGRRQTASLAALCREPGAIYVWPGLRICAAPLLILLGCSLSSSHRGGSTQWKRSRTSLHFPGWRMKTIIPSEILGVQRLKFLRGSWAWVISGFCPSVVRVRALETSRSCPSGTVS